MIILVGGADSYRAKEKLKNLREEFSRKHDPAGINTSIYNGEVLTLDDLRQAVFSVSLLSPKRLIVIKHLSQTDLDLKEVSHILQSKPADNLVIAYEEKSKADLEKFIKLLKPKFEYFFEPLTGADAQKWIIEHSSKQGFKIGVREAAKLIDLVGNDLWRIVGEIKKLYAYQIADGKLDTEKMEEIVYGTASSNIFKLINALSAKRKSEAARLLRNELEAGTPAEQIFALVARQIKIILAAKTDKISARALGVHPFVLEKARVAAANFNLQELKNLYACLLEMDVRSKTGVAKMENLLTVFVAR